MSLEASLLEWVLKNTELDGRDLEIGYETNLLEKSILDSVAFIDLLEFVEQTSGHRIDLMTVEPADITSIRALCQHVEGLRSEDS